MASSKVSSLTASDALAGTELFYADGLASSVAADVKVTATKIKTWTSSSPTLVTPVIGVASGTSLALNSATIGTNTLAINGLSSLLNVNSWTIPTLNSPGYLPPQLAIASQGTVNQGVVLANSSALGNVSLTMMASAGTLASPTAQSGAGMALNFMNYVGGAIADWRTFAVIEAGNRGGAPAAEADVLGRIQLGAVNGSISLRPGVVVYNDSITVTNAVPIWLYNTGHANVFDGNTGNYERGAFNWSANILTIGTEKGGTGVARAMNLVTDGTTAISISTTQRVGFVAGAVATPSMYFGGDTTTGFWRNASSKIGLSFNGALGMLFEAASTGIILTTGFGIGWGDSAAANVDVQLFRGTTNRLQLLGGSTPMFQFGGGTSASPALKKSSTILQVRLADDSAYAPFEANTVRTATAYTVATLPAAGSAGRMAYVTDALAPSFLTTVVGGGAVVAPVFDNGTNWVGA